MFYVHLWVHSLFHLSLCTTWIKVIIITGIIMIMIMIIMNIMIVIKYFR